MKSTYPTARVIILYALFGGIIGGALVGSVISISSMWYGFFLIILMAMGYGFLISKSLQLLLSTILTCAVGHQMGYKDLLNYSNIQLLWSWSHRFPDKMSETKHSDFPQNIRQYSGVVCSSKISVILSKTCSITLIDHYTYTVICLVSFPTSGNCHLFCILRHQDQ